MADFSVAIMAGGHSSRMGQNKALMPLNGKPLFDYVLDAVMALDASDVIISTNCPADFAQWDIPKVPDEMPDKGPIGGIATALKTCVEPDVLVVACDMPLLNVDLLRNMLSLRSDAYDIIVPAAEGYPQCLHAIYNRRCLPVFETCLQADRLKLARACESLRVRKLHEAEWQPLDPGGRSFFNTNTPEDFAAATRMMQDR